MNSQLHLPGISTDPGCEGFDLLAGEVWIYPTNYSTRDYQLNIVKAALFKNTMVSLPTGLGKTFIAAVVMYNFYRWYPDGKIIFMAPTRPLVKQQVEACYNITAIPEDTTAELTGSKLSSSRSSAWISKRVFFVTPQVLQNDLEKVAQLGAKIKCLVFDEAHRAKGNHAYCEVIRKLTAANHMNFRVLALSATPGSNIDDVAEVCQNLLISHLEFRTEESLDVRQYVFERSLETVVVQLNEKIMEIRDEYMKIVEYYAKTLIKFNIIRGNCGSLTKGKIFMLMKDFQNKHRGTSSSNYSEIMRSLNICVTLYHALELLIRHGLRSFLSFFDEHIEKPLLRGNTHLRSIIERVRNFLGPIPPIELLPDGSYPEIPDTIKFGHPKHYKLREILTEHFTREGNKNTRVIVFFEYRESVMEAHVLLLQSRPLIQPKVFIGQGSGVTQKTQLGVIKAFKDGRCNTLLSTSIGEEGLDVGEVDLIICFDISNKSPIRMVQRMGRTGRKRAGNVLVLVTEGKEQQTLKDCLIHKTNISTHVLGSKQLQTHLTASSPRLIPPGLTPRCEMMFITVQQKNTMDKFLKRSSDLTLSQCSRAIGSEELIPSSHRMISLEESVESYTPDALFNCHLERIRTAQKVCLVGHSAHTKTLNELLHFADSKRFNIPTMTQFSSKHSDINNKYLKQGDIRNMFSKNLTDSQVVTAQFYVPFDELCTIFTNYLKDDIYGTSSECRYCPRGFDCRRYFAEFPSLNSPSRSESEVVIPSETIVNEITLKDIEECLKAYNPTTPEEIDFEELVDIPRGVFKPPEEIDLETVGEGSFFEVPASFTGLMKKLEVKKQVSDEDVLAFFLLESINDMFRDSSLKKEIEATPLVNLSDLCDLSYFGLNGLDFCLNEPEVTDSPVNMTQIIDYSSLIEESTPSSSPELTGSTVRRKRRKLRNINPFLDLEANLSHTGAKIVSEDEEDDLFPNTYDQSFVNDESHNLNNTEMHCVYLKSIRSPAVKKNLLQRRRLPPMNQSEIFSQLPPPEEENDYLEDSFVVDVEDDMLTQIQEEDELEMLEKKLKRQKKRKRSDGNQRRKRIRLLSDDSDS